MKPAFNLDKMTTADKIRAMENLWEDLCRHAEEFDSPAWHQNVLGQREQNVLAGEAHFEEWEAAKIRIKDSVS